MANQQQPVRIEDYFEWPQQNGTHQSLLSINQNCAWILNEIRHLNRHNAIEKFLILYCYV